MFAFVLPLEGTELAIETSSTPRTSTGLGSRVDAMSRDNVEFGSKQMKYIHRFTDEAHFWLNGYVDKPNCRIWSEANPQVYAKTPLHPEKLTVWCALWAGGILLQKR
ncbi:hypothetical protein TNCV_2670041 [Trichonephila clavipes]|nr:hypothetical protein TNCV_2670041 [Trichonephila clavipes]